jgi:hypothetical protein
MTQAVLDYLMWHHFGRVNITSLGLSMIFKQDHGMKWSMVG